jgi:hypothetical protein
MPPAGGLAPRIEHQKERFPGADPIGKAGQKAGQKAGHAFCVSGFLVFPIYIKYL